MKRSKIGVILVAILFAAIAMMPLVSAADHAINQDVMIGDLGQLLEKTKDLSGVETIVTSSEGSRIIFKLNTELCPSPISDISNSLKAHIEELATDNEHILRVLVTTVQGDLRTSYELNPETSQFEKLADPIDFPKKIAANGSGTDSQDGILLDYVIVNSASHTKNGNSVTFWADSYTSPTRYLPAMSADARLLKWSGSSWDDYAFVGTDRFSVSSVHAQDTVTASSGTYKVTGDFSGVNTDYTNYSDYKEESSFVV